jgi:hypothetical protein
VPDDSGFLDTPLSLEERRFAGLPVTYFTDLLYSDTIEDLRLAQLDPIRDAYDNLRDDSDAVHNPSDSLLHEFDLVEKTRDADWEMVNDLVTEVSDTDTV